MRLAGGGVGGPSPASSQRGDADSDPVTALRHWRPAPVLTHRGSLKHQGRSVGGEGSLDKSGGNVTDGSGPGDPGCQLSNSLPWSRVDIPFHSNRIPGASTTPRQQRSQAETVYTRREGTCIASFFQL